MRSLLFAALSFICNISFSQSVVDTFTMTYFDKESYTISVSESKNEIDYILIQTESYDKYHKKTGLLIKKKQIEDFVASINLILDKAKDWEKVAKEKNVNSLEKSIELKKRDFAGYFYAANEYQFDFKVKLYSDFKIIPKKTEGSYYVTLIGTDDLVSNKNDYLKQKGVSMTFLSVEELSDFVKKIDPIMISKKLDEIKNTKSLFK